MSTAAPSLAAAFLRAVRTGDEAAADGWAGDLADLSVDELEASLPHDAARIATWLNVYNAVAQRLAVGDPRGLSRLTRRSRFFRRQAATVAGVGLSLDAIEHGLLRRSRWKLGLGWLGNPLPSRFERRFRVARADPRIHFALNCAAASCPPIGAYDPDGIDAQLDMATRAYLAATVRRRDGRLVVPRVFLWFPGDFGGPAGIRRFLARHGAGPGTDRLRFAAWDWTPAPGAWAPGEPDPERRPDRR
jgi:hypothetical protein